MSGLPVPVSKSGLRLSAATRRSGNRALGRLKIKGGKDNEETADSGTDPAACSRVHVGYGGGA